MHNLELYKLRSYISTDPLPVEAVIGGTVGLVVMIALLLLAVALVIVFFIKRRKSMKVKISGG